MRSALILLTGLTFLACDEAEKAAASVTGGGQDAGPIEVNVDVDAGTVAELPADEKAALCDKITNAANDGVSLYKKCNFGALLGAASAAAEGLDAVRERCRTVVESCRTIAESGGSAAEGQIPEIELPGCSLFKGDTSSCATPVEQLETCLSDIAKAAAETVSQIDCDTLTVEGAVDNAKSLGSAVPDTPACAEVGASCPGLFEAGSGAGGAGGAAAGGAGGAAAGGAGGAAAGGAGGAPAN
jgi:hypothetical protein